MSLFRKSQKKNRNLKNKRGFHLIPGRVNHWEANMFGGNNNNVQTSAPLGPFD